MNRIIAIPILLIALSLTANADVIKCKSAAGKIIYQSEPCVGNSVSQGVLNIKAMTPEEVEQAKAKLKAEQEEEAAYEMSRAEEYRQKQIELERQESLALQRRSVMAQEQALAQRGYQGGGGYGYGYPYGGGFIRQPMNTFYPGEQYNNLPRYNNLPSYNSFPQYNNPFQTGMPGMPGMQPFPMPHHNGEGFGHGRGFR